MKPDTSITVYCKRCGEDFLASGAFPQQCPECHRDTTWTLFAPVGPKRPYAVTQRDTEFLRSIRVAAD